MSGLRELGLSRQPSGAPWRRLPNLRMPLSVCAVWTHPSGAHVLSAVELVEAEDGSVTEEWHVSVSFNGGIADNLMMSMVRRDFGMEEAFEDNHQRGIVRNLWLAINPRDRKPQCSCVGNEKPHEQGCRLWRDAPEVTV